MRRLLPILLPLLVATTAHARALEITLKGSRISMERQNQVAQELDYSFLRTDAQVERLADAGSLVAVPGGEDYQVLASWPYARPAVRDFIERLAPRYRRACDEPLVVTSLTRPVREQPRNASPLSVHPAGMAVDLRVSRSARCVDWLQEELLALEEQGLLDATREYRPPHFHIAVFPGPYEEHVAALVADSTARAAMLRADSVRTAAALRAAAAEPVPAPAAIPGGLPGTLLLALVALVRFVLPV
jgi:hypothetical protein